MIKIIDIVRCNKSPKIIRTIFMVDNMFLVTFEYKGSIRQCIVKSWISIDAGSLASKVRNYIDENLLPKPTSGEYFEIAKEIRNQIEYDNINDLFIIKEVKKNE